MNTICGNNIAMTFNIGDYVQYQSTGLCQIEDCRQEDLTGKGNQLYYVLKSVYDKVTTYVPATPEAVKDKMRHLLTSNQINDMISKSNTEDNKWIENSKLRQTEFSKIIKDGDRKQILWLVKVLLLHKKEVEKQKKKFYSSDERVLMMAEKMITEEFAFVLGMDRDDVIPYIRKETDKR